MTKTTRAELLKIIRSTGVKMSTASMSSRVKGWGNHSEGVEVGTPWAFKNRYQRDNRYHYSYSREESHDVNVRYNMSTYGNSITDEERAAFYLRRDEAVAMVEQAVRDAGIEVVSNPEDKSFKVFISNPYFGQDNACSCGKIH